MKNPYAPRLLAILAVVGLCLPAVSRGWDLVRFSKAQSDVSLGENGTEALRSWADVSGLAFTARASSLTVVDDWDDKELTAKRRDEEAKTLAARPLSSEYWLLLSDMRLITGEPIGRILEALEFS